MDTKSWATLEGKRSLGSSRHKWEDNIMIYHKEIVDYTVGWIHLAQGSDK
jgi:hypothetical protein